MHSKRTTNAEPFTNDYLGVANDLSLREEFLKNLTPESFLPTSILHPPIDRQLHFVYEELEQQLSTMFEQKAPSYSIVDTMPIQVFFRQSAMPGH